MKILIVEDEFTIALNTEMMLKENGHSVIGITDNLTDVLSLIVEEIPDVILMDINLGEGDSGIDIARKLKKIIQVPIIFLSAYSDTKTVTEALGERPFGYLVKPYKKEDLLIAIQVAKTNWLASVETVQDFQKDDSSSEYIFIQDGSKVIKLHLEDLLFLQAMDNYTIVQTSKEKIIVSSYLSVIAEKFNLPFLVQNHRSYYVNINNINYIDGNMIHIANFKIPISRSFRQNFIDRLNPITKN